MNTARILRRAAFIVLCFVCVLTWGFAGNKYERIEAIAQGQEAQLGQRINITIIIYEVSDDAARQALMEAFQAKGQEGLFNALDKIKSHGRIAVSGTLGYDIKYIRETVTPQGRELSMVTDRPLRFGEVWSDSRSKDYNLCAFKILLANNKKDSTGILLPEMELKMDPEKKELKIEAFRNPWKIMDILDYPVK